MKIENVLMRGFYAGLMAGIVGGIALTSSHAMMTILGFGTFFTGAGVSISFDLLINHLGYAVGSTGIFGGIFGIIYSKIYNIVPGKNICKGFRYHRETRQKKSNRFGKNATRLWHIPGWYENIPGPGQ